jgi:hypothetical protein
LIGEKYITASCTISNNIVCKNNTNIFENKNVDLSAFLLSGYRYFNIAYPKFYKMDQISKLGWLACEVLLKDSFLPENYLPEDIGIILSNADASLDTDIKYFETVKDVASPSLFVYTLPNIVIGEICIRNNFKGENAFFIFEHFDADFIEKQVSGLLDRNVVRACICGWVNLLGGDHKAALFLIEKNKQGAYSLFTRDNMDRIFNGPIQNNNQ